MSGRRAGQSWVFLASCNHKPSLWYGPVIAPDRNGAKAAARSFVARYLPDDTRLIRLAPGTITVRLDGPDLPFDEAGA